jgi:hypothetical protein
MVSAPVVALEPELITAEDAIALKTAIRQRVRDQEVDLWPYITLAKQSELDEDDEE